MRAGGSLMGSRPCTETLGADSEPCDVEAVEKGAGSGRVEIVLRREPVMHAFGTQHLPHRSNVVQASQRGREV